MHDKLEEQKREQLLREKDLENKRLADLLKYKEENEKKLTDKLANPPIVLNTTNNYTTVNEYHKTDTVFVNHMEIDESTNNTISFIISEDAMCKFSTYLLDFDTRNLGKYINRGAKGLKQYQIDLSKEILALGDSDIIKVSKAFIDVDNFYDANGIDRTDAIDAYNHEFKKYLYDQFASVNPQEKDVLEKQLIDNPLFEFPEERPQISS